MIFYAVERHHPPVHCFERDNSFPLWTLSYLHSGAVEFESNAGKKHYSTPIFFLIPPRIPYVATMWKHRQKRAREAFAFFSPPPHLVPLLQWADPAICAAPDNASEIRRAGRRMREVAHYFEPPRQMHYRHWAWNALEETLLILAGFSGSPFSVARDHRIQQAIDHIHTHYREPTDIGQLATACGLSASHFAHLFREKMDLTPMQYVETTRLHAAAELLLSSSATAAEIAIEVGFENASHFTQRFVRRYGLPPRLFRNSPESAFALLLKERSHLRE